MKCEICKVNKLRREFPTEPITDKCVHAPLQCMRCVTQHVAAKQCCPECDENVPLTSPQYQDMLVTLKRLFPEVEAPDPEREEAGMNAGTKAMLTIEMIGGETTVIPYRPLMTISNLKSEIHTKLKVQPHKQRLLYMDKELKEHVGSGAANLQTFGVKPFATISLIVILYSIPETFDEVIFDLFWGYPVNRHVDYLDASVLLYCGHQFVEVLDYRHTQCQTSPGSVYHSGDVMDDRKRIGHHTINVRLKRLPAHVNKLFFTLSAWNSPNISAYKNPSLKFYEAKRKDKQLCDDRMDHAAYSQAIIMCSLCRMAGAWQVYSLKSLSAGNARQYGPLKASIVKLISDGKT